MHSSFGWLDTDDEQRRRMLEVVDLFKEHGTIDELGVGSIRDTVSNALFPGTSTLHTRLRYVLFLPWLMEQASHKKTTQEMADDFRRLEFRLIDSLLQGGELEGVIGNRAKASLKRLPSVVYWTALREWGIVDAASPSALFRRQLDRRRLAERTAQSDDFEADAVRVGWGVDAGMVSAPEALTTAAAFALTAAEEEYLSSRIATSARGTLLAWLVANPPADVDAAGQVWEIANLDAVPQDLAALVEHARRFSLVMHGASLTYNVALARKGERDDAVEAHSAALAAWQTDDGGSQAAATWDRADWWETVARLNPRLRGSTRAFVDAWNDLASSGGDLATSDDAVRLVSHRERQLKGSRARFVNQGALDRWSGESGLGRLDFRWPIARSHLLDLYAARGVS